MMRNLATVLSLNFLVLVCLAGNDLITRRVITPQDSLCTFSNNSSWNTILVFPNGLEYPSTSMKNQYADYHFRLNPGLQGEMEILIFKNLPEPLNKSTGLDDKTLLIIHHAGMKDTMMNVNFFSDKVGWFSLGKFRFNGNTDEFLRVVRNSDKPDKYTIAPTFRFDWYFDLKTRLQKSGDPGNTSPGFTVSGSWFSASRKGFSDAAAKVSVVRGAKAIWNPGKIPKGNTGIFIYNPVVKANDKYEVYHDGKIEEIFLNYREYANFKMYNPVALQGWFKIGEFEFNGNGHEFVRLTKMSADTTYADCIFFETIRLDGTIVDRTVVTPKKYEGSTITVKSSVTFSEKEKKTGIDPGLSPIYNENDIVTSMKNGYTCYGRAYWLKSGKGDYFWNPLITEPGDYDVSYFTYYPVKSNGKFKVFHSGTEESVEVKQEEFVNQSFHKIGTYSFTGGLKDEFVQMSGIDRASDMLFEKKLGGGSVLKQLIVTGHPYFKESVFEDTKQYHSQHDISVMVLNGFVGPESENLFNPDAPASVNFFLAAMYKILIAHKSALIDSSFVSSKASVIKNLLFGIPGKATDKSLTKSIASGILLNATELTGKYQNVKNIFSENAGTKRMTDLSSVPAFAKEAYEKLSVLGITGPDKPDKSLTKAEATCLLKEFTEQVLHSGPPFNADWELTFNDEFDGENIDYSKWHVTNTIRFKGLSAKWAENSKVENGLYKGYNYFDNHLVPYSSGEIVSKFKQTNGFFEARYKYPDKAYGSHSSFWTSSPGGDFNYNEGTYPNGISNNNYFLKEPERAYYFKTKTNLAHDFHTISAYLDSVNLFYGFDGQVSYEVKNYPQYYAESKTTQVPYGFWLSTIVTYFDGPLDRDRIDGSFMAVDWIRVYKKTSWLPALEKEASFPPDESENQNVNISPVLKFNKSVNTGLLTRQQIIVTAKDGKIPSYSVEPVSPVRIKITFEKPLLPDFEYRITLRKGIKDLTGNESGNDEVITFKTKKM